MSLSSAHFTPSCFTCFPYHTIPIPLRYHISRYTRHFLIHFTPFTSSASLHPSTIPHSPTHPSLPSSLHPLFLHLLFSILSMFPLQPPASQVIPSRECLPLFFSIVLASCLQNCQGARRRGGGEGGLVCLLFSAFL